MNRELGLPAIVVEGLLVAGALGALLLLRRREARGGLLPSAIALALLTPSCAAAAASVSTAQAFGEMAQSGDGAKQAIVTVLRQSNSWLLAGIVALLVALGIAALLAMTALVPGPDPRRETLAPASGRRLALLAALACAAPGLAAPLVEHTRQNLELVRLVISLEKDSPEEARAVQRHPVLALGIESISDHLAQGFQLGRLAFVVALVLAGIAGAGALAGGGAAAPRPFAALGLLLLLALSGVACFWVSRLALELRALGRA